MSLNDSSWHRGTLARVLCLAFLAALPAFATSTDSPEATATQKKLPPLIDREVFFGDPLIAGAQISPDGKWISFLKPNHNVMNIWIKGLNEPFDSARPITADSKRPVRAYFWSRDSRFVLYLQDKGGNENYHIYAVDPKGKAAANGVPTARDLTPYEKVRVRINSLPKNAPGTIIVGINDRDPSYHDMYKLDIATGERTLLVQNDAGYAGWLTDLKGEVRLAMRMTDEAGVEILELQKEGPAKVIYSCAFEESCAPIRFHKDSRRIYLTSNKGPKVDLIRLMLLDPETGKTELVESDPENEVDFGGAIFSQLSDELIATAYIGDRKRIYPRSKRFARNLKFLERELPNGEISIISTSADESLTLVSVSQDVNPGAVYLFNSKKRKLRKLYDSRLELPVDELASMRSLRYKTRDGASIPAYLTLPEGIPAKKLPTVIFPHGGPWARDHWGYNSLAQFLANRGYAVLQPNFRGSTGYGKRHLNAGNNGWGTGIMQHDLSDAVKYLVDQGIADPKRMGIMGGSYGGYATLAGVAFTPDIYAAGVSIVGPSNIITLFESIPPYWKPIRKMFLMRVGDPDDPKDHERLVAQSPFYHAKQIKAPLLVIQGANDPRVKKAESDQIVVALRDLDRHVEYLVAPDEGHGFQGKENRIAMFAVIERFLAEQLGGRYQKNAPTEIAARIKKLQVDVKTVEMPRSVPGIEAAKRTALPTPVEGAMRLLDQHFSTIFVLPDGREMKIESDRSVTPAKHGEAAAWQIEISATSPTGDGHDIYLLDAATLRPLRRSAQKGPMSIELLFSEDKVTGTIKTPGGNIPVDTKLEAPVFGDDAALTAVLASLPLATNYSSSLRVFDLRAQKTRPWMLKVLGTEKLSVPAGEFMTFKLSLSPLDGGKDSSTFWVNLDAPRMVIRYETEIETPRGNIKVHGELQTFEAP